MIQAGRGGVKRHVVLILDQLEPSVESDMRRWWRGHCIKHTTRTCLDGNALIETYFEVGLPVAYNVSEGVKRLASFGVRARGAHRDC